MKAVRWLISMLMVVLLCAVGCASNSGWETNYVPALSQNDTPASTTESPFVPTPKTQQAEPTSVTEPTPTQVSLPPTNMPTPPQFVNWLSPTKVTISNFHAGAVAEYPITFHNAKTTATDKKQVTTGDNETIAVIPLNSAGLYLNAISNITGLNSDNPKDQLGLVSYDSKVNGLLIEGFEANSVRILTVTYKPMTAYSVYFKLPDTSIPSASAKMAQDWVLVANPTLVMAPLETANDTVSISMPTGVSVPDKTFEFWIGVSEISKAGGVALSIELVSRWIVNMR